MQIKALFEDDFDLSTPQTDIKSIIKKASPTKDSKTDVERVLKNKKLSIAQRLAIITEKVLSVLGKQRDRVLVIKTKKQLHDYITEAINSGRIAIDTETNNSLDPITCKLMGPCFYYPGGKQAYVPLNHINYVTGERLTWQLTELDIKEELQRVLNSKTFIIMHNGKFDYEVLKCTCDIVIPPDWDTMIAARLLNENELAGLKWQYINKIDPSQEKYDIEHLFEGVAYAWVDPDIFALYAATDSFMTDKLYLYQKPLMELPQNERLYNFVFKKIEMPIVAVTAEMELRGVCVDQKFGAKLKTKYDAKLTNLDKDIAKIMAIFKPIIDKWRLCAEANTPTKIYEPKKTKKTREEVEIAYPEYDKNLGKRFKYGKISALKVSDPLSLTSPVQLGILFYDILKCKSVNSKSPRGTGENELKDLKKYLDSLSANDKNKLRKTIINMLWSKDKVIAVVEAPEEDSNKTHKDQNMDSLFSENLFEDDELNEQFDEDTPSNTNMVVNESCLTNNFTEQEFIDNFDSVLTAASQLCDALLERRGLAKLITTYIDVIPSLAAHWPDGRIRFHLNSLGTDTGRYSSGGKIKWMDEETFTPIEVSGINIQNVPSHCKEIRLLFEANVKNEIVVSADSDYFIINEIQEIETKSGWKYPKDLAVNDLLLCDNEPVPVKQIIKKGKNYFIYF